MLAGGLFALTAKTYAEGASMYPEAGGSSSFARHAFNEVVSFFAGWALTLDYVITIAISAFFVPHYLGAFWPALNHNPGDIIGGAVVVGVLALLNIRGLGESAKLNLVLAVIDLVTQVVLVVVGFILVLDPKLLLDQIHLGTAPSFTELIFALSVAMVAYTGIETVSNMAEEAKEPAETCPRRSTWSWSPCSASTPASRWSRCRPCRSTSTRGRSRPRWARPTRTTPCWASSTSSAWVQGSNTDCAPTSACWRRRSCSSPPTRG